MPLGNFIAGIVTAFFILGLLFWTDPKLAVLSALILGTAYILIYSILRPKLARLGKERVVQNRMKYQVVSEAFGGIKEIKVGGLESTFFRRYQRPARDYARSQAIANLAGAMPRYLLEAIAFGGMLSIALYLMSTKGNLAAALPTLALYALAGYRLMPVLQQIYGSAVSVKYSAGAVDNLYDDFNSHQAPFAAPSGKTSDSQDKKEPITLTDKIELDQVTYRYPSGSRNSLDQVSLTIPANHTVGFVGPTGSGKTTTVDLILGLLMPTSGQLRVDGRPITAENIRRWQRLIGYVPQQIYLADDSVAGNIAFGIPPAEVDMEAVRLAARIANLDEFVSKELPDGYATVIGERGVRLSGGQRQRIGIARALYHRPSVLVMDEATSALDNLTEVGVMQAIEGLNRQMTIILIAHRLTTVKKCDTIFLLEAGRLVGQGTYDELVDSNERFRALASSGQS
jgi:ABC-type multidrug transport system fused ATPase/permease subunit